MLKQTPLPDRNQLHSELKFQDVLPLPESRKVSPGAHDEAKDLLLRFNPRLIGFGIASPSPNPCPEMSAPTPFSSIEPLREKRSKEEQ